MYYVVYDIIKQQLMGLTATDLVNEPYLQSFIVFLTLTTMVLFYIVIFNIVVGAFNMVSRMMQ